LHRFRLLCSIVFAVRFGADGVARVGEQGFIGEPGTWIVFDHQGGRSNWPDVEFRHVFEPVDALAQAYLDRV
jgi:hypothetical protein